MGQRTRQYREKVGDMMLLLLRLLWCCCCCCCCCRSCCCFNFCSAVWHWWCGSWHVCYSKSFKKKARNRDERPQYRVECTEGRPLGKNIHSENLTQGEYTQILSSVKKNVLRNHIRKKRIQWWSYTWRTDTTFLHERLYWEIIHMEKVHKDLIQRRFTERSFTRRT